MFSNRTARDRRPDPLAQRRARAGQVLDLAVWNPTQVGVGIPSKVIGQALQAGARATYTRSPLGLPEAHEAVSDYYSRRGVAVAPGQVVLTATTEEAYQALFHLVADPGDSVLVGRPGTPDIAELASFAGLKTTAYPVHLASGAAPGTPRVDAAAMETGLEAGARAVVLVTPHDPTGACPSVVERRRIVRAAEEHRAAIFSDEGRLDYLEATERFSTHSFARKEGAFAVALSGLSPVAGQPGLKLSWMVLSGPDPIVEDARARLEHWLEPRVSVSTPVQRGLRDLLDAADGFQDELRDRCLENTQILQELGRGDPVSASWGDGGWSAVLRLPGTQTDEAWALEILEEQGVYVLPGTYCGISADARLVVSLIVPPEELQEGLRRILSCVKRNALRAPGRLS